MAKQPETETPFAVEDVYAACSPNGRDIPKEEVGRYYLVILVDAVGIDYSDSASFLRTLYNHPRGGKNNQSIGHSWIIVGNEERSIECGHTGESGIDQPKYFEEVRASMKRGESDPLAYLWEDMHDGRYQPNSGDHQPSCACWFDISKKQYDAIYSFIDGYDYELFSVTKRVCTTFAANVAALAGIQLGHTVTLNIPREVVFGGEVIKFWTDPVYSSLTYGSPDVLEKSLRAAIDNGLGNDALSWYCE